MTAHCNINIKSDPGIYHTERDRSSRAKFVIHKERLHRQRTICRRRLLLVAAGKCAHRLVSILALDLQRLDLLVHVGFSFQGRMKGPMLFLS